MDDEGRHLYFLHSFAFLTIVCIYFFEQTAWLLPMFLTAWSLLSLFRLFVLTTPFQGYSSPSLPHKILATLGLKEQERREDLLIRIFMNPFLLGFMCTGLCYLIFEFIVYKPLLLTLPALRMLFFPFLCGLVFMLFCSHASNVNQNRKTALAFSILLFVLTLSCFLTRNEVGVSGYEIRAGAGGFWLASLPYISGFLIVTIPVLLISDGVRRLVVPSLFMVLIFLAMGMIDIGLAAGGGSQAILLTGWIVCGLMTGPILHKVQGEYLAYKDLKETLDFRTKIEHS